MRTGQMQALAATREVKGHPFDAVDIGFGLLSAVSGSPIAFGLALGQYFARRSAWVAEALLAAMDLPPAIEDSRTVRALLPGVTKLLPASPAGPAASDADAAILAELTEGVRAATRGSPAAPATEPPALGLAEWRDALDDSPHLLIYGPSKAGKSTLAQAVVAMFKGCEYVVIDPQPNKPGEQKWGGIDFITLDERGADEYASIKAALDRIKTEDDRRRRGMRTETPRPLVVIIDEVLALVGALGTIINDEGKKEPRMAHFIRTMGYSARHRNIKIVLIGQGKNLVDLGLNSGTARNNYATIRVSRNAASGARAAAIETGQGDQPIELRHVLNLAQLATTRGRPWLRHVDLARLPAPSHPADDDLLSSLLAATPPSKPPENAPEIFPRPAEISANAEINFPARESDFPGTLPEFSAPEIARILASIVAGKSKTEIIRAMPGYAGRRHALYAARYEELRRAVDAARISTDPDAPDPDGDVPPAFRGIL